MSARNMSFDIAKSDFGKNAAVIFVPPLLVMLAGLGLVAFWQCALVFVLLAASRSRFATSSICKPTVVVPETVVASTKVAVKRLKRTLSVLSQHRVRHLEEDQGLDLIPHNVAKSQIKIVRSAGIVTAALAEARQYSASLDHVEEMSESKNFLVYDPQHVPETTLRSLRELEVYTPPTLYNNHIYTVSAPFLNSNYDSLILEREILCGKVAGHVVKVAVDWAKATVHSSTKTVIVMIPGFGGNSEDKQYKYTAWELSRRFAADVAFLHDRGEGGLKLETHALHHKMRTDMLDKLIRLIDMRYPQCKLFGLGFSQGGAHLLKHLQESNSSKMCGAVTIGSSYDYRVGIHQLESVGGIVGRVYSFGLAKAHLKYIESNLSVFKSLEQDTPHSFNLDRTLTCRTLLDLDQQLAKAVYGHSDVLEYHDTFKIGGGKGGNISCPVLCIHASDDPLFSCDTHRVQRAIARTIPSMVFMEVPKGGHLSFCEAGLESTYSVRATIRFFESLLG